MENPLKMDDLGGPTPIFGNTQLVQHVFIPVLFLWQCAIASSDKFINKPDSSPRQCNDIALITLVPSSYSLPKLAMYTSSKSSHNSKHMVTIRPANTDQELNAETVAKSYPTSPLPVVILGPDTPQAPKNPVVYD